MKLAFLLLLSLANAKPLFFTLTKADTNYIILTETPKYGAVIYRDGKKITEEPIKPVSDPAMVSQILGDDYESILEIVGALDATQLMRKLKHSKFQAGILSLSNLKVATILGRVYKDAPVDKGKRYTYRVVFLRFNGRESTESQEKSVKSTEILPDPPEKIEVKPGDKRVVVKWKFKKWQGKPGDYVVSFNVYRREKGEKAFSKVNARPIIRLNEGSMEFVDQWVSNNRTYEYGITSVDLIGRESEMSTIVEVKPVDKTPPLPPAGLIVIDGHGSAVLKWNYSLELDAAGYNVYRTTRIGEKYTKVNDTMIPFSKPFYRDTTVSPGRFFYAITAIDSSGNESKKSNPMMVIIKDSMPPDPPKNVRAYYKNRKIYISWDGAKAKDLMGYYVYRGTIKDKLPKIIAKPLQRDVHEFEDKGYSGGGFSSGYTYFVGVTSIDSSRNESELIVVQVSIPDSEPPQPPSLVQVKSTDEGFVRINFMPSPSLDVDGYRILRNDKNLTTLENAVHFYIDSTVKVGTGYTYSVIAIDTAKNESKPVVSKEIIVTDQIPPDSPTEIHAYYTDQGVKVTWKGSTSNDLEGYNVYRADLPNGRYEKLNDKPVKQTEFLDKEGKKYHFYRVSAVDVSGNESTASYVRPEVKK